MPNDAATEPTTAIERTDRVAIQPFQPRSIDEVKILAKMLADSALVPVALRQKPADVATIIMHGASLGIDAMASLRQIHIIDGKPVLAADLIVGLILRSGAAVHFSLVESTGTTATYETHRRGAPRPVKLSFTIDQARAANLLGKGNWRTYPDAMLRARCAAALGRVVYPDVCGNLYDPDELEPIRVVDVPSATSTASDARVIDVKPSDTIPAFNLTPRLDRLAKATTGDEIRAIDAEVKPAWDGLSAEEKALYTAERNAAIEAGKARAAAAKAATETAPAAARVDAGAYNEVPF
jgi:hypothetical protein